MKTFNQCSNISNLRAYQSCAALINIYEGAAGPDLMTK